MKNNTLNYGIIFLSIFVLEIVFLGASGYCDYKISPEQPLIPFVDNESVRGEDSENVIPTLMQYSPILYIHSDEKNLPIKVEEYFAGSQSSIKDKSSKKVVIPAGSLTIEKIYDLYKSSNNRLDYYVDINDCVKFGSDPQKNKNAKGNLNTPIYALTFSQNGKLYIQYLFFYGFNAPYGIGGLFASAAKKYLTETRGAHVADLEHITIELDEATRKPLRIYYGSHGRYEGMWLNWDNKDIEKEGDHPIVFVARGGHGLYPRAGTYLRIYGASNDITNKGIRWEPNIVRIYKNNDKRFDPKTMGWLYLAGTYGKDGVNSAHNQSWFGDVSQDIGRPYDKVPFCPHPASKMCLIRKAPSASIPK